MEGAVRGRGGGRRDVRITGERVRRRGGIYTEEKITDIPGWCAKCVNDGF